MHLLAEKSGEVSSTPLTFNSQAHISMDSHMKILVLQRAEASREQNRESMYLKKKKKPLKKWTEK